MYKYSVVKEKNVANVKTDRIFKLIPLENGVLTTHKRSTFNLKMFTGDTKLHAVQEAGLWRLEYKDSSNRGCGTLPQPLTQRFTGFNSLLKFIVPYFAARNVKIEEIIA